MSAVEEMSSHVQLLSRPSDGESVKARIGKAAVKLGYSWGFTKRLWFKELKRIDTEVSDHIRAKAAAHDRILKANMVSATAAMLASDPEFYREHIEAISQLLLCDGNKVGEDGNRH